MRNHWKSCEIIKRLTKSHATTITIKKSHNATANQCETTWNRKKSLNAKPMNTCETMWHHYQSYNPMQNHTESYEINWNLIVFYKSYEIIGNHMKCYEIIYNRIHSHGNTKKQILRTHSKSFDILCNPDTSYEIIRNHIKSYDILKTNWISF